MYDPAAPAEPNAGQVFADRVRKAIKQPTMEEWGINDYEVRVDSPTTKGESFSDLISCLTFPCMRMGFLAQTISLLLILCIYRGHGGENAFTFDLYNFAERFRNSETFTLAMVSLLCVYGFGVFSLLMWQSFVSDNSKLSRGFRAGSKVLGAALTLDLFVIGFRLLSFIYGYHFLQTRWWLHNTQTKTDFSLFYFGALAHGIALILYGVAIFYLEAYHDEGTYEEFAWICLGLFGLAGACEILMVLTGWGACFSVIQLLACAVALIWSLSYEPTLLYHASALHDRNINDDALIHTGAEQFAMN